VYIIWLHHYEGRRQAEPLHRVYVSNWQLFVTVGIENRQQAGRSGVPTPVGRKNISLLWNVHTASGAHTTPYSMCTGVLSWG